MKIPHQKAKKKKNAVYATWKGIIVEIAQISEIGKLIRD
jgi:hypothetical protein